MFSKAGGFIVVTKTAESRGKWIQPKGHSNSQILWQSSGKFIVSMKVIQDLRKIVPDAFGNLQYYFVFSIRNREEISCV